MRTLCYPLYWGHVVLRGDGHGLGASLSFRWVVGASSTMGAPEGELFENRGGWGRGIPNSLVGKGTVEK